MIVLLAAMMIALAPPEGKPLPKVPEPAWDTWKDAAPAERKKAEAAWDTLREYRPDREYPSAEARRQAEERVQAAYRALEANPGAACAVGVERLRRTRDDWERMMVATTVQVLGKSKGEPFLIWAMAHCSSVDEAFEPSYEIACHLAERGRPEVLPAIFVILRAHAGAIYLPLHAWTIPTHDCLFYVVGRYGEGAIPYLYPMLSHSDPYVRRNAAFVLGYFLDEGAKPTLLKMVEADDVGSGGAAFALGQLGAPDAVRPLTRLLASREPRNRFWAAYALFEIGSKEALPALEAAAKKEMDEEVKREMTVAIDHLRSGPRPFGSGAKKLDRAALDRALSESLQANGLRGDAEAIAASAGAEDWKRVEQIRRKTLTIPSDLGHKSFRRWTEVLKAIRRRAG